MTSPFKFLDAFKAEDFATFFGRAAETEQAYRLIGEGDMLLVYGQSGTGKTSLIQCGLANRIQATDWHPLWIRRRGDINASLLKQIRADATTPIDSDATAVEALKSLYLDHLRPAYLIFDQFEELFVLGSADEQEAFYQTVRAILDSDLSCQIIVTLREEYLARLERLEQIVPTLFSKRLRVELMSPAAIEQVITGTCKAFNITLEHDVDTARLIIDKLSDGGRSYVQLAYLQVYLDSLYNQAVASGRSGPVIFADAAIEQAGQLDDVLSDFLDHRIRHIRAELRNLYPDLPAGSIQSLLEEFVSVEGTKQPNTREELVARLPASENWIDQALSSLHDSRILRVTEDRYELAHDALAARIEEMRSNEHKAMLQIRKMVRDGMIKSKMVADDHSRSWWNRIWKRKGDASYLQADELAIVKRAQGQRDPLSGHALLALDSEEQTFVDASRTARRRERIRKFSAGGLLALIIITLLGAYVITTADNDAITQERYIARLRSDDSTDNMAYLTYLMLLPDPDPSNGLAKDPSANDTIQSARLELIQYALGENNRRDEESDASVADADFWNRLSQFTEDFEAGNAQKANQDLTKILHEQRIIVDQDPEDWDSQIRYKAALMRGFHQSQDIRHAAMGRRLVNVMQAVTKAGIVDYSYDISFVCTLMHDEAGNSPGKGCDGVPLLKRDEMPFYLVTDAQPGDGDNQPASAETGLP